MTPIEELTKGWSTHNLFALAAEEIPALVRNKIFISTDTGLNRVEPFIRAEIHVDLFLTRSLVKQRPDNDNR